MKRRSFLGLLSSAAIGVMCRPRPTFAAPAQRSPNLIVVLVDDMGWRDTGFAQSTFVRTPCLDALASRGVTFTQAYAAAPNCAPTRACLMTGQYTPRHGVYTVQDDQHQPGMPHHRVLAATSKAQLDPGATTLAEILSHAGYATGMVGMWNLGRGRRGPCTPTSQGFDSYVQPKDLGFAVDAYHNPKGDYLTDRLTDAAMDFVRSQSRPFFLYLATHAIHAPFDPKAELLAECLKNARLSKQQAAYAATVAALDQNIGRLWALIEALGISDQTYLLFTSDNGATHPYNAPLRGGKGELYEGGIRVPAFVIGPRVRAGTICDDPISSIDVLPTFAELAGVDHGEVDGVSLVQAFTGQGRLQREALYWHFPCYVGRGTPASAIRRGDWKLIEFFESQSVQLYNLADDPGETRDLSVSATERAQELHLQLRAWQDQTQAPRPITPNPDFDPRAAERGRNRRMEVVP
jgi:arylsulfatase A-like enzyme